MRNFKPVEVFFALAIALAYGGSAPAQELSNPRRISDGPAGVLLVAERSGAIVGVDKETLNPQWSFPLPLEGAPFGLVALKRLIYVGNTTTMSVEVYKSTGSRTATELRFQYVLGEQQEEGQIKKPIDIAVDRGQGLVFVLDGAMKQVKVFDRKGAFLYAFSPTDHVGELLSPVSLGVDTARGELLVTDYGDPSGSYRMRRPARILIYTYDGELLFQIDGDGSTHENTQFVRLQGIVASADGRIFVAETLRSLILVLDRNTGALIEELGTAGDQPGELMLPLDLFLDETTGDLFVSNNRGARPVEVLRAVASRP